MDEWAVFGASRQLLPEFLLTRLETHELFLQRADWCAVGDSIHHLAQAAFDGGLLIKMQCSRGLLFVAQAIELAMELLGKDFEERGIHEPGLEAPEDARLDSVP